MFAEYNNGITKINKLLMLLLVSAYAIVTANNNISRIELIKLVSLIGIVYVVLENYYPTVSM